jgi:asparagine synthase (glutamine-hydrolysing)
VVAFTSAPRAGFSDKVLPPRIGDESGIAAEVAALYSNVEHVVVRSGSVSPLDRLGRDAELFQEPVGHPCNSVWWSAVHEQARARGINVMLTGEVGNLTTSAGGLPMLAEFVRKGRMLRWWREARAVAGTGPSWRGVLATSFGPWTPIAAWNFLSRVVANDVGVQGTPLLHPEFRPQMEARALTEARLGRPPTDNRKFRWDLLQQQDPGNFRKGILARSGIDERDPTADRRLAEFCFSLPPDLLFSGGVGRRLARVAFADRLPASVLSAPRGYQYADWYERISEAGLRRALADLAEGAAASVLDLRTLESRISSWPSGDWHLSENIGTYRLGFLKALSAGSFANRMSGAPVGAASDCALAAQGASR